MTKNAKRTKKSASPSTTEPDGSQALYNKYLSEAEAVDDAQVVVCRRPPALVYHNVARGVGTVTALAARIKTELPGVSLDALNKASEIALALTFAARQVEPRTRPTGAPQRLVTARQLRRAMLRGAQALAEVKLLDPVDVRKIEIGSGPLDVAQDLVDLAALFGAHPEVMSKTAITAQNIADAASLGDALLKELKPRHTPALPPPPANIRDRMFTLLLDAYEQVWRVGAYLLGPIGLNAKVPSVLASSHGPAKKSAAKPAPVAPAPAAPKAVVTAVAPAPA